MHVCMSVHTQCIIASKFVLDQNGHPIITQAQHRIVISLSAVPSLGPNTVVAVLASPQCYCDKIPSLKVLISHTMYSTVSLKFILHCTATNEDNHMVVETFGN